MANSTHSADARLVQMTVAGDHEAYKQLVARYQGHVYGLAYSLVGDWAEAQDIAQETFIRAYTNLDQLLDPARFAAWLRRVSFGVAMDWLRTFRPKLFEQLDGRVDLQHLEIPDFQPGPPEVAAKRELADAVLAAVASLPPKYRVPLTMFHLDGLSYEKVADFLDIPLGTVKSMIHRAKEKLRAALPAAIAEEMTPVVQEVFSQHKLTEDFARNVIEGVPTLSWDKGKQCTFAGALEAAMAVTDHPYTYTDIMGLTALAFRTRWWCCAPGQLGWCPSCAVGEMEEEIDAARKTTGWELRIEVHPDIKKLSPDILASIDAGKPIPAYADCEDMAVLYGYEQGGRTFIFRDYNKGQTPHEVPVSKVGWLWIFLGDHAEPLPPRSATIQGLQMAVHNWRRERGREGPGEYWYGRAALRVWSEDLAQADSLTQEQRDQLHFVSVWNCMALADARKSAVSFLRAKAVFFAGPARETLERAASLYQQEVDIVDFDEFAKRDWSDEARAYKQSLLTEASRLEEAAIAEIEKALAV